MILPIPRRSTSWQLILADLSLILFLMTAAALSSVSRPNGGNPQTSKADSKTARAPIPLAAAQSIYRAGPGLETLAQWLKAQPHDPRAALTIIAQHEPGKEDQAWRDARAMAATAKALDVRTRVIIREGKARDLYASLAYDQPR